MNIIDKISNAKLVGRGGACFPVAMKWQAVKNATGKTKYVICNAAEGEPGILKDGYILDKHGAQVIDGMKLAMRYVGAKKGIIYINESYLKKFRSKLKKAIEDSDIEFFAKPHHAGYIGGEECSVLNAIEGRKIEPRLRPPYPTDKGLFACPTLINNVETFYNVSLVNSGEYKNERFFTINGDCSHRGVIGLPETWTIEHILQETDNIPKDAFFVQIGGDASGMVYNESQLKNKVTGAGSITVHLLSKHDPIDQLQKWVNYFTKESCGQCTSCREGTYRLKRMLSIGAIDWESFAMIIRNLESNSFCGLGSAVAIPIRSYINNVLPIVAKSKLKLKNSDLRSINTYFKKI